MLSARYCAKCFFFFCRLHHLALKQSSDIVSYHFKDHKIDEGYIIPTTVRQLIWGKSTGTVNYITRLLSAVSFCGV